MAQFTRNAIRASFLRLLAERPLDRITVKDLVEDCGVSRNAFYYHYRDLFDLAEEVFTRETEQALRTAGSADSWEDGLLQALQFALEHRRLIVHACRSSCRDQVVKYLFRVTEKVLNDSVDALSRDLDTDEADRRFLARFYTHALVGMFLEWVDGGFPNGPDEMIHRMGTLLQGNLRAALLRSAAR